MFPKEILHSHCHDPGPQKALELGLICWPLIQELIQLELGIKAFDVISQALFLLHAYLILVFGDIPTMALVMCMKGQNGIRPFQICNIKGVCFNSHTNYVPLQQFLELHILNNFLLIFLFGLMRN